MQDGQTLQVEIDSLVGNLAIASDEARQLMLKRLTVLGLQLAIKSSAQVNCLEHYFTALSYYYTVYDLHIAEDIIANHGLGIRSTLSLQQISKLTQGWETASYQKLAKRLQIIWQEPPFAVSDFSHMLNLMALAEYLAKNKLDQALSLASQSLHASEIIDYHHVLLPYLQKFLIVFAKKLVSGGLASRYMKTYQTAAQEISNLIQLCDFCRTIDKLYNLAETKQGYLLSYVPALAQVNVENQFMAEKKKLYILAFQIPPHYKSFIIEKLHDMQLELQGLNEELRIIFAETQSNLQASLHANLEQEANHSNVCLCPN